MFTKPLKVTPENGMVLTGYPKQNDITFCADLPFNKGKTITVVTAVKSCGKYLEDMEGSDVKYCREHEESGMRVVAIASFPDGIPADYLAKLNSYQAEDFTVEYHEEAIVE
jgi:hypothetical protein